MLTRRTSTSRSTSVQFETLKFSCSLMHFFNYLFSYFYVILLANEETIGWRS